MSDLTKQIDDFNEAKKERMPADVLAVMDKATEDLKATGIDDRAIKDGQKAPAFTLPNHLGKERTLAGYLQEGPVVLSFYRGGW